MSNRPRIVVGISGATGIAYGVRILEFLRAAGVETHLVVSKAGHLTRAYETDLSARVLRPDGEVFPGLYAAGEVAGFGGGGMHGYASLEGTFLGGCLFSGRTAGRRFRWDSARP